MRGETLQYNLYTVIADFSIHSPLAGRDPTLHIGLCSCSGFQSTRPLRGETVQYLVGRIVAIFFNPLAPCWARQATLGQQGRRGHFQSTRPLRGETLHGFHSFFGGFNFQSTRPLRGETFSSNEKTATLGVFNPLAPCGARPFSLSNAYCKLVFQSTRPLRGETGFGAFPVYPGAFSIHSPLAGRDATVVKLPVLMFAIFNPLAPCGARPPF